MNSSIRIIPGNFNKSLEIPTSKSHANRLLILGSLFPQPVVIKSLPKATDVINLIKCLEKIGLQIVKEGATLKILNSFPACEKPNQEICLNTGDGGTTNRFLLALLARGKNTYILKPDAQFLARPNDDFLTALSDLGVWVEKTDSVIKIKGPLALRGDEIHVPSTLSTQFASALALSLADLEVKVIAEELNNSKDYLFLTFYLVECFKRGGREFSVPIDFSSLSYPLALAALNGSVRIENFTGLDPYQGDAQFLAILKKSGVEICHEGGTLAVKRTNDLIPLEIDCHRCLDLVPTLSFYFSHIPGTTILKNINALAYKESNRILEIQKLLNFFQKKNQLTSQLDLEILGDISEKPFVEYIAPQDHRMIMTAFLFMKVNNGGIIKNFKSVDKSFPNFFEIMTQ